MEITDPTATVSDLRKRLSDARGFLDLEGKSKELVDLREKASSADLWDNPDVARVVSQRLSRIDGLFEVVDGLSTQKSKMPRSYWSWPQKQMTKTLASKL